jgi:tetratricopeptide (TPR) repeat protein
MMPFDPRIEQLADLWRANPKSGVWAQLANAYFQSGLIVEAIDTCLEGLRITPQNIQGILVLAKCLLKQGRLDEAIACYGDILSFDPQNLVALSQIAQLYYSKYDYVSAYQTYKEVLIVNPYDAVALGRIKQLEEAKGRDYFNQKKEAWEDKDDVTLRLSEGNIESFLDGPEVITDESLLEIDGIEKREDFVYKELELEDMSGIERSSREDAVDLNQGEIIDFSNIEKTKTFYQKGLYVEETMIRGIENTNLKSETDRKIDKEKQFLPISNKVKVIEMEKKQYTLKFEVGDALRKELEIKHLVEVPEGLRNDEANFIDLFTTDEKKKYALSEEDILGPKKERLVQRSVIQDVIEHGFDLKDDKKG